jgi:PIN domain nuclease of toxin-antitoxin system
MVIDTHVLLWWMEKSPEISEHAKSILDTAALSNTRFIVCSISFWELRMKEVRGLLNPKIELREWPKIIEYFPWLQISDTTSDLWMASAELKWTHRDPADRIIAATALRHRVSVLTKDQKFHDADSPVKAVW